ncbi:hypothetical protein TVAG_195800 [Trichomonas vaginalis G3]|uniref:CAAX prenyl protease 1 N-terminal domain-containing protein n=1 Tax=Trichomonas vaginalis (strain ATCC PRA-98 / G3) TaxID=412133 RepID=A2ETL9_TRIV3|nr:CAAX prenyl protease 1 family [Trichomonas vaginalis G3]EAY03987.1 hypothetical protein TVAG_195800 [Trichomonas vaginalis G3]KAI5534901.1 CAAX prenyl protease 1 family [Trichomonas vaginalis G3]|eukprot:XP_001316210.1 hypothetical protein [Trichomonas vaginalis G3]
MKAKNPFIILLICTIGILNIITYGSELVKLNSQYKIALLNAQDIQAFNYPKETTIVQLAQHLTCVFYYYALYSFHRSQLKFIRNDYQLVLYIIASRWLITSFPFSLWQIFYIDSQHGFNKKPLTLFLCEDLLLQLIILIVGIFLVYFFNFVAKTIANINDDTLVLKQDQSEDTSSFLQYTSSSNQMDEETKHRKTSIHEIFNLYFIIVGCAAFLISFFIQSIWKRSDVIQPNAKLSKAFSELFFVHRLLFNNPIVYAESSFSTKLAIGFQGLLSQNVVISDNLVNSLNNGQLCSILAIYQYRANSQEGVLKLITYIFELMFIPVSAHYIVSRNIKKNLRLKNMLLAVVPILVVHMFIVDFFFSKLRLVLGQKMFLNGVEFASDLNLPIADALVRLFVLNHDTINHSFLYSLFQMETPTLENALINVAWAKTKFIGL